MRYEIGDFNQLSHDRVHDEKTLTKAGTFLADRVTVYCSRETLKHVELFI
jgi:hypothetical protein